MADIDFQALIEAARLGVQTAPVSVGVGSSNLLFVPLAGESKVIDLQQYVSQPRRAGGTITVFEADSFLAAFQAMTDGTTGPALIYVDKQVTRPSITAVLNEHSAAAPGWRDHRVHLHFRETSQWAKWKSIDGKMLDQVEIAEFVEDNMADIASPSGAEMLEIAQYFSASRKAEFKSVQLLSSGAYEMVNAENVEAKVKSGRVEVPAEFELGIAPYEGVDPFKVPVRLRYRMPDGKLQLGIRLQRVEELVKAVLEDALKKIGDVAPIIYGQPG